MKYLKYVSQIELMDITYEPTEVGGNAPLRTPTASGIASDYTLLSILLPISVFICCITIYCCRR